jgi:glutaredoxin 3
MAWMLRAKGQTTSKPGATKLLIPMIDPRPARAVAGLTGISCLDPLESCPFLRKNKPTYASAGSLSTNRADRSLHKTRQTAPPAKPALGSPRNRVMLEFMTLPILYIKPGCPWCDEVIDFLRRQKIEVKTIVVSGNPDAMREMVELSGQTKAPTMNWHGEVLADFGVEELIPFLKQQGIL